MMYQSSLEYANDESYIRYLALHQAQQLAAGCEMDRSFAPPGNGIDIDGSNLPGSPISNAQTVSETIVRRLPTRPYAVVSPPDQNRSVEYNFAQKSQPQHDNKHLGPLPRRVPPSSRRVRNNHRGTRKSQPQYNIQHPGFLPRRAPQPSRRVRHYVRSVSEDFTMSLNNHGAPKRPRQKVSLTFEIDLNDDMESKWSQPVLHNLSDDCSELSWDATVDFEERTYETRDCISKKDDVEQEKLWWKAHGLFQRGFPSDEEMKLIEI